MLTTQLTLTLAAINPKLNLTTMRKILASLMAMMLFCIIAFGQTTVVTGKVTDASGVPLPNASVRVKGSKSGTSSAVDGTFKITVKAGSVLEISEVGFETKEVLASGDLNVSLAVDTKNLNEVVVTALGIRKQAKELGYSAATVAGKDLEVAAPISVANGLTGKVSGLTISTTNNGLFAPTRVTLRGNRSLTGNNQALIVVDGAIYYNDISTINPDDIVDINILKGASASAIYGSDASNGVMLITTKKGTKGKSSLTISSTAQVEAVSYMPALQNSFGSNGGEAVVNDFNDLTTYIPYENQSYGPRFNGKMVPLGRVLPDGTVQMVPYSARPNEKRDFFANGTTTQNNMSFQSGDDHGSSFISLQDVNSKAVMPGDIGRRDAVRLGGTKTYGIFSANYSVSYTYKYKNTTNTGAVYENVMNSPAHVPLTSYKDWQNNKFATLDGYYNDYFDNPYWDIANQRNKSTEHNISANLQLAVKPVDWLTLSYRGALTEIIGLYEYTGAPHIYSAAARTENRVIYANYDASAYDTVHESAKYTATSAGVNGSPATYRNANANNLLFTSDFVAGFSKDINSHFIVRANAGISYMDNLKSYNYTAATALLFPVYNVSNVSGTPSALNGSLEARKFGMFGDATVGFNNFAFLHGSYRTDIDSRLSKDNRYIPYYDVDASFVITDAFPKLVNDVFSFAKIRGAYSITGNISPLGGGSSYIADGAYIINPTYVSNGSGYSTGQFLQNTTVSNPGIKPEITHEKEVGVELGFFKSRVYLTASAYRQETTSAIVTSSTASSSGFYKALLNAANTINKGIELELKTNIIKTRNTSWSVNLNYTYNVNNVTVINGNLQSLAISPTNTDPANLVNTNITTNANSFAVVGNPFPVIQTYDWVRDPASGKIIVDPITGNPSKSTSLTNFGRVTPKDIFGFTSSFTWKRFTFNVTGDFRGGYKIFNSIGQYMDFTGISATSASTNRQRFVYPNSVVLSGGKYVDNTNIMVDDANFNFWPGIYRSVGANYMTSAAAFKIREVAIAYQFSQALLSKTKIIKNASLTVSGRNLLMIRPKSNLWTDPEFSEGIGNDAGRTSENQTPPTRIFSATLSITL